MNVQATPQHVTPFDQFVEPSAEDQLWASILGAKQAQDRVQQPAPMPQQTQTQPPVNNQVTPEGNTWATPPVDAPAVNNIQPAAPVNDWGAWELGWWAAPTAEPVAEPVAATQTQDDNNQWSAETTTTPESTKTEDNGPKTDEEFDNALAELEKELWLDTPEVPGSETEDKKDWDGNDVDIQKGLERDKKFLKIINELDSTNKKTLARAWELEVKLDTASTQMEYYKQQAQNYYEELRGNEFDRNRFEVTPDAKNFVHYFNEYSGDKDNIQAKDSALREAIKIVNKITGRDLNNYLADYFTMWTANLWELQWWAKWMPSNFNKSPGIARDADTKKRSALWNALSNM